MKQYMKQEQRHYKIAYYSGTGGTERAAYCLAERLAGDCRVTVEKITSGFVGQETRVADLAAQDNADTELIVLFPVYAFNAPRAVYRWLDNLPPGAGKRAAVISVSGGGEISPNTACRLSSIKRLTRKGYDVTYEKMLVMPSNFGAATEERLAVRLLLVLPQKIEQIAADLLSQVTRRTKPVLWDRLISLLCEAEKPAARLWGRCIKVDACCNSCGWCSANCPSGNIKLREGKPCFHYQCHLCLKCIYGCPQQALKPGLARFIILKDGYDLAQLAQKSQEISLTAVDLDDYSGGYVWKGVVQYLKETDK